MTGPSTEIVTNGHIASVSWSHNGDQLWAGGKYDNNGYNPILGWQDAKGEPVSIPITTNTVMDIRSLSNGDLLVASTEV